MRWTAVSALAAAAALSGCMQWYGSRSNGASWDAFDSGRGLFFGTALLALLVVGVVVLVTNLSGHGAGSPPTPAEPTLVPSPDNGWVSIDEPASPTKAARTSPGRTGSRKPASKSAKPRRRTP